MAKINGGSAMYSRTVKTGEYENKKAEVVIQFGGEEGEDTTSFLNAASTLAMAKVHEMLGIKLPASHIPPTAGTPEPTKRGAGRPSNAAKAAAAAAGKVQSNISTGGDRKDPAAMDDFDEGAPIPKTPETNLDDFGIEVPAVITITDTEIGAALQRKMGEIKDGPAIRALVAKYAPVGANGMANARDIPQDKRADFLKELTALKSAAA